MGVLVFEHQKSRPRLSVIVLMVWVGLSSCATTGNLNPWGSGIDYACLVGDVTPHEAEVWIKTVQPTQVKIQYTTDPLWVVYGETLLVSTTIDRDNSAQLRLTGLEPNTPYRYRSVIPGKKTPGPECYFKTAPPPDAAQSITFVIGGNTRHRFQPYNTVQHMTDVNPDFFVYLGDTIYADKESQATELPAYWAKYAENREGFLQKLFARTSVYPMWDDHEIEAQFDSRHRMLLVGRQAFLDYWPIRTHSEESTRLYRKFRWGQGMEMFLLDGRQYRNPQDGTMLGEEQKSWLLEELEASTATFKFIVSPVPFSDPGPDTWGGFSPERNEILSFIKSRGISGVIFLAGGVHHAGVGKIPGSTHHQEFIFGPLGAHLNYVISGKEPRFLYFYEASPNYGKITVQADKPVPSVQIEWFDHANTLLHQVLVEGNQYIVFTPQ